MITLGIDFAASPSNTACCLIDWNASTVEILDRSKSDFDLVDLVRSASIAAIDIPLGWPDSFVQAVVAHNGGRSWTFGEDRDELRFRLTDRVIRSHGYQPLSVSSDRIGVGAMRAARLQSLLEDAGVDVDRSGVTGTLVEVYPAAALRAWGFSPRGYKGSLNLEVLEALSDEFVAPCGYLSGAAGPALEDCDDDDFDAFVCALMARAARTGLTSAPADDQLDLARREGWIHLPAGPLAGLFATE